MIIEVAFTMETMALELMDYSLNWTLDPFHSVVYSRQDNFSKMEDICKQNLFNLKLNTLVKNIFSCSNWLYNYTFSIHMKLQKYNHLNLFLNWKCLVLLEMAKCLVFFGGGGGYFQSPISSLIRRASGSSEINNKKQSVTDRQTLTKVEND